MGGKYHRGQREPQEIVGLHGHFPWFMVHTFPRYVTQYMRQSHLRLFQWTLLPGDWHSDFSFIRMYGLMIQRAVVILGSGYTARFVLPLAARRYTHVLLTSRQPDKNLRNLPAESRIRFDLEQSDTWTNVPKEADLLWCFPAAPLNLVQQVASTMKLFSRRLVVLGSTSAYDVGEAQAHPPPWIDETAPIDLTKLRVQGEEFLRKKLGAIVLRVAGIYGPGRNPLDWIGQGRVGPSRKYVNLIHAEDLASICLLALDKGKPGEAYNVSDGTPRTWEDICRTAQARWGIAATGIQKDDEVGKRISNHKLVENLQPQFQHPDLYTALQTLT